MISYLRLSSVLTPRRAGDSVLPRMNGKYCLNEWIARKVARTLPYRGDEPFKRHVLVDGCNRHRRDDLVDQRLERLRILFLDGRADALQVFKEANDVL